jgi:predicted SprT family Zn-dependent metalloprotease
MLWSCPACRTTIAQQTHEALPRPGVIYRCYVCRLELQLNQQGDKLELVPLPSRPDDETIH